MGKLKNLSISDAVLFTLSFVYLAAEVYFNMSLLDVAGTVTSNPADVHDVQVFGRVVSAFGCLLLVLGFFSVSQFRLHRQREIAAFAVVGILSAVPFFMILLHASFRKDAEDVFLSIMPLLGFFLVYVSRAKFRLHVIAALFLMVWPAIFLGQKLLIEEYLVDTTSAEARGNARYVLLLRAGFENCSLSLDDLELCDARGREDLVKSARIIMSALWTLYPEGIREDMIANREKLVQAVAARDDWFSNPSHYREYVDTIAEKRQNIEQEIIKKYYAPYRQASDMYLAATDPQKLRTDSSKIADDIDEKVDAGWQEYGRAVQQFQQMTSAMVMGGGQRAGMLGEKLKNYCDKHKCPDFIDNADPQSLYENALQEAERKFAEYSGGYPPDILARDTFMAYGPTQAKIRATIEKQVQARPGFSDFTLPDNWRYDRESFIWLFETVALQEAREKWKGKFGDKVKPGMTAQGFFRALGISLPPPLEKLVMSKEDFFAKYILPKYKQTAAKMIDGVEAEKPLYANGEELEQKGRDYVRAVYIPAIALVVSLIVVTATVGRWVVVLVSMGLKKAHARKYMPRPAFEALRAGLAIAGIAMIVSAPYFFRHPYAEGGAYGRYLSGAEENWPTTTRILDWAIHAQPVIYRIGSAVGQVF